MLVAELFVANTLNIVFYLQYLKEPGNKTKFIQSSLSVNVLSQISQVAISLLEYMLAAFLLISLFKIRESLKGSSFNFMAMKVHLTALICQFSTRWIVWISVLIHDDNETLETVFTVISIFFKSLVVGI